MDDTAASNLTRKEHFFFYWMPYLFQPVSIDAHKWAYLPLNRLYKPLGVRSRDHLDYEEFAFSHGVKFSRDPHTFEGIWTSTDRNTNCDEGRLWLYRDSANSRKDYFDRLERLMSRSMPMLKAKK